MKLKCITSKLLRSVGATLAIFITIALVLPTEVVAMEKVGLEYIMYYDAEDELNLARVIVAEYNGCNSAKELASVAWTVCNRASDQRWPSDITEVIFQPNQFHVAGMPTIPSDMALEIARDVLSRWNAERNGAADVGRTIPSDSFYFWGDGERNHFNNGLGVYYEPVLGPYEN